jgi:hypothetical protein
MPAVVLPPTRGRAGIDTSGEPAASTDYNCRRGTMSSDGRSIAASSDSSVSGRSRRLSQMVTKLVRSAVYQNNVKNTSKNPFTIRPRKSGPTRRRSRRRSHESIFRRRPTSNTRSRGSAVARRSGIESSSRPSAAEVDEKEQRGSATNSEIAPGHERHGGL